MIKEEFIKFIRSIGFDKKNIEKYYTYKSWYLNIHKDDTYDLEELFGSNDYYNRELSDLEPFNVQFKQESRSIKLKMLLKK